MVSFLISLAVGVIGCLIYAELAGRSPRATSKMLDRAVQRLPRKQRERMREEWAADLLDQPSPASAFVRACGFRYAAETILLRERRRVRVARATRRQHLLRVAGGSFVVSVRMQTVADAMAAAEDRLFRVLIGSAVVRGLAIVIRRKRATLALAGIAVLCASISSVVAAVEHLFAG